MCIEFKVIDQLHHFNVPNTIILFCFYQWNNHGYDIAKLFKSKFGYVSPVWLQVKVSPGGVYYVQGTHDIDKGNSYISNLGICALIKKRIKPSNLELDNKSRLVVL